MGSRACDLCLFSVLVLSLYGYASAVTGDVAADWQQSRHHLSALRFENQHLPALLGTVLDHQFTFPETALRKGMGYIGANFRLRRVVKELLHTNNADPAMTKRPIKIALIGGSISWGHAASRRGETDWFALVSKWVVQTFPHANVTLRNGCVPATPSAYMIMCLEMSMDSDADIVFVEYVANDGMTEHISSNPQTMVYERLMRRILAKPHNPAVILMQVPTIGMAHEDVKPYRKSFHQTQEDSYGAVAQYYDLQYLSMRTASYRLAEINHQEHYRWSDIMASDRHHPQDTGYRLMAELAIWLLQQTAIDLVLRPFGRGDQELLEEPLPKPMFPGNVAPSGAMCVHQDALLEVVSNATGFDFINEGTDEKPKKGFVSSQPGSHLTITIDSLRDGGTTPVTAFLAFLKSYRRMGRAMARCISGCTCTEIVMEAHQVEQNSQLHMEEMSVTQAKECKILLTLLPLTSSEGHKFKLGGVMVSEQGVGMFFVPKGRWGTFVHENPEVQMTYTQANAAKPIDVQVMDTEVLLALKAAQLNTTKT